MNLTEATILLTSIARVDHRNFGEEDVEIWADLLDDIDLADAMPAAREHFRADTRWLTPAILREHIESARGNGPERLSVAEVLRVPDTGEDDSPEAYIAALRAGRFAPPAIPAPRPAGVLPAGGAR